MGLKSSSKLTLSLLIIAALCMEVLLMKYIYYPQRKTWTEARLHCQRKHIDLATWESLNQYSLRQWLREQTNNQVWIGLHRDPAEDSVWKSINVQTGEGLSGANLTQSSHWYKEQSGHCAVIGHDKMWHSVQCSTTSKVYCSVNDKIKNHGGKMNWYSASRYCRKRNSNLSTITTTNKHEINSYGWIGLYRQAENNWTWIGNMSSMYRNWAPGEPLTKDCGSVDRDFKWHSNKCSKNMSFVCYDDKLVVVNENKTWEEALTHCKGIKAICESPKCRLLYNSGHLYNSSYIRERIHKATTDEVWIGLRFLGGRWLWMTEPKLNVSSIQQKLKVQETLPQCPSMANCGALSKHDTNDTNNWIIRDCTERRNFVCLKQRLWNGAS